MTTDRTVIVAGASGVFGRHVSRTLHEAGYQVLGLGRGSVNEISADLLDRTADESHLGFGAMVRALAAAYHTPKPMTVPTWLTAPAPFLHRLAGPGTGGVAALVHSGQ
jgi:nucleoside-diphosphate-sugar epimerase